MTQKLELLKHKESHTARKVELLNSITLLSDIEVLTDEQLEQLDINSKELWRVTEILKNIHKELYK